MVDLLLFEFSVFMFSMFFRTKKNWNQTSGDEGGGGGGGGVWLVSGTGKNCHP